MKRRGRRVRVERGKAVLRVDGSRRFSDGTAHLEIVRLLALGCKHIVLDLDDVRHLDDSDISDVVSWYHTLAYRKRVLQLVNVRPAISKKLEPTVAFAALPRELFFDQPPKATPRLPSGELEGAVLTPRQTEDWHLVAGCMSLGQWARMRRKQSH